MHNDKPEGNLSRNLVFLKLLTVKLGGNQESTNTERHNNKGGCSISNEFNKHIWNKDTTAKSISLN